jgi:hypothetical protein
MLILKQAGIGFTPPPALSLPLLVTGGLLVGVPGLAQLILWWLSGRTPGAPSSPPEPPGPHSPLTSWPEPSGADR